jgi:hypothetical protein
MSKDFFTFKTTFELPAKFKRAFTPGKMGQLLRESFKELLPIIPVNIRAKHVQGAENWPNYYQTFKTASGAEKYIRRKRKKYRRGAGAWLIATGKGSNPKNYRAKGGNNKAYIEISKKIPYMSWYNKGDEKEFQFRTPNGKSRIRRFLIWNEQTKKAFREKMMKQIMEVIAKRGG